MVLNDLGSGYAYDSFVGGQKVFYRLVAIPFLDLPKILQEKVNKMEDVED